MPLLDPHQRRRGVTLLELLIVLTLIGVTTALVLPVFGGRPGDEAGHEQDVARVLSTGRREAIRRAQTLRLTVAEQGAWTLRGVRDGVVIDSGRLEVANAVSETAIAADVPVDVTIDVTIDAMGGCLPAGRASAAPARSFDPLSCTFERAR